MTADDRSATRFGGSIGAETPRLPERIRRARDCRQASQPVARQHSACGVDRRDRVVRMMAWTTAIACVVLFCGADWRQFRGTDGNSVASDELLPTAWSDTENVAWKVDLPGRGPSSPIVVAGRVIVTCSSGAKQDRLHVLCFAADTGRKQWHRQFWATGRTLCNPTSANAAPTPASDGRQIYAFYSSNDLICLDLEGNLKWYRGLTHDYPRACNDTGMASSPLVAGETVVVQVENQGDSFAAGIDTASGRNRWRLPRKQQASWASPIALDDPVTKRKVLLLQSPAELTAHDMDSGQQLWRHAADCDWISSPVATEGVVYLSADGITALGAPAAGSADPEVLWHESRLQAKNASAVVHRGQVFAINASGVLSCGDAANGKINWRLRLGGNFWATPVAAGDRLYVVNAAGQAKVVELGQRGRVIGTSDFGQTIQGTPAVSDGALYVRSDQHLWKIASD